MALSLKPFNEWVQQQAAAVQASAGAVLNFSAGSVLRALVEANASVALWFQWLLMKVLALTRAATSAGPDLDSWMADFNLTRQAAVAATGNVTFARFTTGQAALVPVGTLVRTADGAMTYAVTEDADNAAWDEGQNGYAIAYNVASVTVPVQATTAGADGNVSADTITSIVAALPGVDTVTNALAFTTGDDAATDDEFRASFRDYINTRSRATPAAVGYAISTVQQGLIYSIRENEDLGGSPQSGHFVVTVDDGTGSPSSDLLDSVTEAIEGVRPVGSTFEVHGPTVVTANVAFTYAVATGYIKADLEEPVETAVAAYINGLGMAEALRWSKLFDVIYSVSSGISNVTSLTVNAGTSDVGGADGTVVRAGTVTAS